ncbi:MAG TPA: macrolide ABC transporter ATP-binding protein [Spirochaetia bacterium]|nr:macrolide ABC transporter ATP-binding protein [Spirochaetia bacterium]
MSVISLRSITKSYYLGLSAVPVLHGIDLDIEKGEYLSIVGSSGSGKSTLMNIIGCMDKPTSGSYILNGKNVENMTDHELSEIRNTEIGFVYQTFNLLMRKNVFDNVLLPLQYMRSRKADRSTVLKLIERVGLKERIYHKPNELSGGQRQRVAIARALAAGPSLLLADEPTGNLDSATTREIMKLFDELHEEGVTIIIVTHEHEIAQHTRKIITLHDGRTQSRIFKKKTNSLRP